EIGGLFDAVVEGIGDVGGPALAFFGRDQDNAVVRPGSVDRGGGVLEDGDRCHVGGVDQGEVAGDTVDQDVRRRAVGGGVSADLQGVLLLEVARLAAAFGDRHAAI